MAQQFAQQQHHSEEPQPQEQQKMQKNDKTQDQEDALDAVLDDISSTLETDAEQYVSSFVQKGGE
ncbi:ubiquitin-like protein Pup [Bifidobacterium sp. ESL0728]|uniref:ubiquitin-like protein Pup n=1 Tax=Bifidobacterium sp. ESL0728 TaxID=2983220 RepID=UPI0023F6AA44|nr:ubiquitin-like protein Pup [Bifidobacterium sp. ESL0728]WEV58365.1 ubiquitin-like protein Pup [Bifidobacterium sp. ESL0728]